MISMITTSVTSVTAADIRIALAVVSILTLVALLIQKEILAGLPAPRAREMSHMLDIAVVPLIAICLFTAYLGVRSILQ